MSHDPFDQLQSLNEDSRRLETSVGRETTPPSGTRNTLLHGLFGQVFDALPLPSWLVETHGNVVAGNASARLRLPDDASPTATSRFKVQSGAHRLKSALAAEDRDRLIKAMQNLPVGQVALLQDMRLSVSSGEQHTLVLQVQALPGFNTPVRHFLVQVLPHAPSNGPEPDARLLKALVEGSDDYIYATDTDGRILYLNPTALRLFEQPADQLIGQPRDKIMPLRDAIEHRVTDERVIKTRQVLRRVESICGPSGVKHYQSHKFPLLDSQGVCFAVGGVSRDVTEQFAQQANLLQSETIFQYSRDAIVVIDDQGHIQRVNPSWMRLTGFSEKAAIGHTLRMLHAEEEAEAIHKAMWSDLQAEDHWEGELLIRTAGGQRIVLRTSIVALRDEEQSLLGYVAIQSDITDLRNAYDRIAELATTDTLTQLPNRGLFNDRLQQTLLLAERKRQTFALLFIDLDHFKEVNDTLGHDVGDALLVGLAQRMRGAVRSHDTVARLGGDEFVVLMPDIGHGQAQELAQRFHQTFQEPLELPGYSTSYHPRASVGLVVYPDDGDTTALLMQRADQAMYIAKQAGRNQLKRFAGPSESDADQFNLHQELIQALQNNELRMFLQPKFRMRDLEVVGAEALVRWQHPRKGLLGPADFLPLAQKHGMMKDIDAWMLEQAIQCLAKWRGAADLPGDWHIAVNQNAQDILRAGFIDGLSELLQTMQLPPQCLEIELTEERWAKATPELLAELQQLRKLGVGFSVDDFGTGYSSLSMIARLPITALKIDQSFVRYMDTRLDELALVEVILGLGHRFGMHVVAEGVENEDQRLRLMQMGCELGQGYLFSPPLPVDEFFLRYVGKT